MQELKDRHQLLELEHRLAVIGLQHEPEGANAGIGTIRGLRITLREKLEVVLKLAQTDKNP